MKISSLSSSYNGHIGNDFANSKYDLAYKFKCIIRDMNNNAIKDASEFEKRISEIYNKSDFNDKITILNYVKDSFSTINELSNYLLLITYISTLICNDQDIKVINASKDIFDDILNNAESYTSDASCNDTIKMLIQIFGNNVRTITNISLTGDIESGKKVYVSYVSPIKIKDGLNSIQYHANQFRSSYSLIKNNNYYDITRDISAMQKRSFDPVSFIESTFKEYDEDYLVRRAEKISEIFDIIMKIDNECVIKIFKIFVNYLYDRLMNNSTGLIIMRNELIKCIDSREDDVDNDQLDDDLSPIDDFLNIMLDHIDNTMDIFNNKSAVLNGTPLIEMGFGYIYDIIPSNIETLIESVGVDYGQLLEEAAAAIDFETLNESIFTKPVELYDRSMDDDYEFEKQKRQDKYEFKKQKKQDKYEAKKALKSQKDQDKYEDKKARKQRNEQERHEFIREVKQDTYNAAKEGMSKYKNRTRTAGLKWKEIKLSTPIVYSAVRALKRLIIAVGIGGVSAAAGFNPVFLPIIYLIRRYLKDKAYPQTEKRKIMGELRRAIAECEAKIDQADRQNDMKQKYKLMQIKDKLESQLNMHNFASESGGVKI